MKCATRAALQIVPILMLALTACPGQVPAGAFRILNAAPGVLITELYLAPSGSPHWGPNRLSTPVFPGETFQLNGIVPGNYDMRAVALFPSSGATDELVNRYILIAPGRTYQHTVHFVNQQDAWPDL